MEPMKQSGQVELVGGNPQIFTKLLEDDCLLSSCSSIH